MNELNTLIRDFLQMEEEYRARSAQAIREAQEIRAEATRQVETYARQKRDATRTAAQGILEQALAQSREQIGQITQSARWELDYFLEKMENNQERFVEYILSRIKPDL